MKNINQSLLDFEFLVIYSMEDQGEMTTSDAQGIIEAGRYEGLIRDGFKAGTPAKEVAREILNKSTV
jgi:hypothetical protein